jgi:hypothetical protein
MGCLAAVILLIAFADCGSDGDNSDLYINSAASKLRVNNNSADDLLLFFGQVSGAKPAAGVRARSMDWGVANAPSGTTILYAVTQQEYSRYPSNPRISTSLLAFVDENNDTAYDLVSPALGDCELMIENNSKYHIEVRRDHFDGVLLLTARPWEQKPRFLPDEEYYLYPVAMAEQKNARNQVIGLYSKSLMNARQMASLVPHATSHFEITPSDVVMTPIECLIKIYNRFGGTAEVRAGSASGSLIRSTMGRLMVSAANTDPFIISRKAILIDDDGNPRIQTVEVALALKGMNSASEVWSATCTIGKAYSITCNSDGSWTSGAIEDIED